VAQSTISIDISIRNVYHEESSQLHNIIDPFLPSKHRSTYEDASSFRVLQSSRSNTSQ
jgi:hypothetical protein